MSPKIFNLIKEKKITKEQVMKDVMAGIIVAIIALPLSIALGISSGVSPEKGLITAIVAGFIISFLGGSRVQIGGPTGAFVVIVYTIVQMYGINGLIIATLMAGIMLVIMGVLKLGDLIKYVPHTITVGFTSGIAITLLSTQVKDFLGLNIENVPAEFIPKWQSYFSNMGTLNIAALLVGIGCILIMVFWPKVNKTIPGSVIALIVSTLAVQLFNLPVETIGSRYAQISSSIPVPSIPMFEIETIKILFKPAMTIAILAAIESLLSAVVADGMIDDSHDSNMELIAQGIGNIGSALFGGIPATGAIARTAANVKNGGRSPISGMVHAITLLLIMLLFMPLAKMIPMTTLASVLIVVSYNMGEWSTFKSLLKAPKSDIIILILTFVFTIVFDLVVAIEIGMILAMFLWIRRLAETTDIKKVQGIKSKRNKDGEVIQIDNNKILIYEVNGPFFFGVVQDFIKMISKIETAAEVLLLDMRHTQALDASAISALERLHSHCNKHNIKLIISNLQLQPKKALTKMEFVKSLGEEAVFNTREEGLKAAHEYINIEEKLLG
ncbi:SulP family inorganic anion transporter [Clostridium subterminale]|uniref:SulP family inorganic anion transporter n=1 Tax=Clostridium subterminale TaxID=1550 RepID=A0ABP3W781_CLOSU